MNLTQALAEATRVLSSSSNPQLYGRTLLAAVLNVSLTEVFAINPHTELSEPQQQLLTQKLADLNAGIPFDYVVGYSMFRGTPIKVTPAVLIPRPETEQLVQLAIDSTAFISGVSILEIGTGSGCVSVTLFQEVVKRGLSSVKLTGIDKSAEAMTVTYENMHAILDLEFDRIAQPAGYVSTQGQVRLLNISASELDIDISPDLIISNPPYVTTAEMQKLDKSVANYEPHLALDGGNDGLEVYRDIANYISQLSHKPALFLEISPTIASDVKSLFEAVYTNVEVKSDLFGKERFLVATAQQ